MMTISNLPSELTFRDGLVGFPGLHRFTVRTADGPIVELVSIEEPDFGLLVTHGELVRPGLGALLAERELVAAAEDVLVVLSIHGDPPGVTANLAGPIVVGSDGGARQLVVEDPDLPLRSPVATTAP